MIKKRKALSSDPDVTAYSDIAFLMIIFFILTTNFSKPLGRVMDMPSASKPDTQKVENRTPSVNILADRVMFGDSSETAVEVTTYQLRQELARLAFNAKGKPDSERMVVVEAAEDVDYQRYFEIVLMIAESGGIIAMVQEDKP